MAPPQHITPSPRPTARRYRGLTRALLMAAAATLSVFGGVWVLAAQEAVHKGGAASPAQGAPDEVSVSADVFDIGADTLSVDGVTREARFTGHVVARRGDWVLRCPSMVARYDESGALLGATLKGPVEVTGPDFWAEAGAATVDRAADTIVLTGEPSLRRGQSVLRASQVTVHVESDKVEMSQVRGRFVMEDLSGVGAEAKGDSASSTGEASEGAK